MTRDELEAIRKHDAALDMLGIRYNERAAEERRALLSYVDCLLAVVAAADAAAESWLSAKDWFDPVRASEAYRAARKSLEP